MPRSFLLFSSKYVKCVSPHPTTQCLSLCSDYSAVAPVCSQRGGNSRWLTDVKWLHNCCVIFFCSWLNVWHLMVEFVLMGIQFALHIAPASLNKRAEGGVNEVCLQCAHSVKLPVILSSLSHSNWVSVADLFHRFGFINEKNKTKTFCLIIQFAAQF